VTRLLDYLDGPDGGRVAVAILVAIGLVLVMRDEIAFFARRK
jgi:hypothetical protein